MISATVEAIGPDRAAVLLQQTHQNRPLSERVIKRYAGDMAAGNWELNGQGIILSDEDKLLDGQHRLQAIIRSGATIMSLIVRGAQPGSFKTLDSGLARTLGQLLAMEGYKNYNTLAAVARMSYNYTSFAAFNGTPTKTALEAFIKAHPAMMEAANLTQNKNQGMARLGIPTSAMGSVLFLGSESGQYSELVEPFIEGVSSGIGLYRGDPRLSLRNWMEGTVKGRRLERFGAMKSAVVFAGIARAWSYFVLDKPLMRIQTPAQVYQDTVRLEGFQRDLYPDVPDLRDIATEARLQSLAKAQEASRQKYQERKANA